MEELPKIKVLLVEDDQMIIDMYKMRLEEEGFLVFTTDKGSEAVKIARKEMPDIVLLDIILPEMDGFSVLRELKQEPETSLIPVVMLTNLGQEEDKEKGMALGAAEYFIKAWSTPADIIDKVRSVLTNK